MATADRLSVNKDFFHCNICLDSYDTPRSLPCLHTFCHSCLTGYIQKLNEQSGIQSLLCPLCRADTKTDNGMFNSLDKWVEYFPINFTLLSILNESKTKMDTRIEYCEPCLREEIKIEAIVYCYNCVEKLCEDCKRHHKKNKLSSGHKLFDIGETSENTDLKELEYLANLSKCPKHNTEEVKYLCKDHDQLCCNECAIVTHRKCEDMVSLAEEISEKGDSYDIQEKLESIKSHAEKLAEHESVYVLELAKKEKEVECCLKQFKADIDEAYDKLEHKILSEMSARKLELSKASSLQKEAVEHLIDDVGISVENVKKMLKVGTATHAFLLKREMEKRVKEYEERVKDVHMRSSKVSLTLTRSNHDLAMAVQDVFQIHKEISQLPLPSLLGQGNFRNRNLTLVNEYALQEKSQPRYCLWIGNCIVVAFLSFSKINIYNAEDGSILSSFSCSSSPTALADLENGEIAVSFPATNEITVLKLEMNRLTNSRLLVNTMAELIAYNRQQKLLFAVTKKEKVIKRFCLDGKDAGLIRIKNIDKPTLQCVCNIAVDNQCSHLYLSSHDYHSLISIDMSGKVVFEYKIACPSGVTVDSDENIYVSSYGQNSVHQLNTDGQLTRQIISRNILQPLAVCFNKYKERILITCFQQWRNDSCIKIYEFEL